MRKIEDVMVPYEEIKMLQEGANIPDDQMQKFEELKKLKSKVLIS